MVVLGGGAVSYERGTPVVAPPCPKTVALASYVLRSSIELSETTVRGPYGGPASATSTSRVVCVVGSGLESGAACKRFEGVLLL